MTWYKTLIYNLLSCHQIFVWGENKGKYPEGEYLLREIQVYHPTTPEDELDPDADVLFYNWNQKTGIKSIDKYDLYIKIFKTTKKKGFTPTSLYIRYIWLIEEPIIYVYGCKNNGRFTPNLYKQYIFFYIFWVFYFGLVIVLIGGWKYMRKLNFRMKTLFSLTGENRIYNFKYTINQSMLQLKPNQLKMFPLAKKSCSPTYEMWWYINEDPDKSCQMAASLTSSQMVDSYNDNARFFFGITDMFDQITKRMSEKGLSHSDGKPAILKKRFRYGQYR